MEHLVIRNFGVRARSRKIVTFGAALVVALGIATSPAAAAPRPSADASAADQLWTITSVGNGRHLDVQNGSADAGAIIVTNSAPGYYQRWRLNYVGDTSFTIVNATTGLCLQVGLPARQQVCSGIATQRWQIDQGDGDVFTVRSAHPTYKPCLDVLNNAQYDDAWTGTYACNNTPAQRWIFKATTA